MAQTPKQLPHPSHRSCSGYYIQIFAQRSCSLHHRRRHYFAILLIEALLRLNSISRLPWATEKTVHKVLPRPICSYRPSLVISFLLAIAAVFFLAEHPPVHRRFHHQYALGILSLSLPAIARQATSDWNTSFSD